MKVALNTTTLTKDCLKLNEGPGGSMSIINTAWVHARLCKLQKRCTRLASDKAYQLLDHGRWFSLGTQASSTTKTGRHDIAEILLKVALNTKNQSINTKAKSTRKWRLFRSKHTVTLQIFGFQFNLIEINGRYLSARQKLDRILFE